LVQIAAGDDCFDEWHKRIHKHGWPATAVRIDVLVKNILEEWDYFFDILNNQ
jgi:hypothetical protein